MTFPLLLHFYEGRQEHGIPMSLFFEFVGYSRQSFYKQLASGREHTEKWSELPKLVHNYRKKKDARAGSRSLYYNLNIKEKYGVGVNKFERIMAEYKLTLNPLRVRVVTTKSSMQSWNYKNLLPGRELTAICQAIAGDITYVHVAGKRHYVFTLIDLYSNRIIGYDLVDNMKSSVAESVLLTAIDLRGLEAMEGCIHLTDGAGQYFSKVYIDLITIRFKMQMSCAKSCMENGYAEQRNATIKHHFMPLIKGQTISAARNELKRHITFYNHERKQESLGWRCPVEFENYVKTLANPPTKKMYEYKAENKGF